MGSATPTRTPELGSEPPDSPEEGRSSFCLQGSVPGVLCPSVGRALLRASGRAGVLLGVSQGEVRGLAGLGSLLEVLG